MALRDFIAERRLVKWAGRRFTARKPTVETVAVALMVYGAEIVGVRLAWLKRPELFAGDVLRACLPHFADGSRTGLVLATCVELEAGRPGELEELVAHNPGLTRELIAAVASVCDPARIIEGLDLDALALAQDGAPAEPPAVQSSAPAGPSAMELIVTGLAERFHTTPFEVMGWPFEAAVLSLPKEILPALYPGTGRGQDIFGMTEQQWAADGVTLH